MDSPGARLLLSVSPATAPPGSVVDLGPAQTGSRPRARTSLDGQTAFHACLQVPRHGAVEREAAGVELDGACVVEAVICSVAPTSSPSFCTTTSCGTWVSLAKPIVTEPAFAVSSVGSYASSPLGSAATSTVQPAPASGVTVGAGSALESAVLASSSSSSPPQPAAASASASADCAIANLRMLPLPFCCIGARVGRRTDVVEAFFGRGSTSRHRFAYRRPRRWGRETITAPSALHTVCRTAKRPQVAGVALGPAAPVTRELRAALEATITWLMGTAARLDAAVVPWTGVYSHAILTSMHTASSAKTVRPAKLRLTPAGLCLSVAVLCVAGALLATGPQTGIRWALLVFASAFFSLAVAATCTPYGSTTQPPTPDQRTPRDP